MTVKRYTPLQCLEHEGTYVTYSDYQKLVAENAALKAVVSQIGDETLSHAIHVVCTDLATPATDAAIAEIKSEEAQNMYESILDNPSVYDMESLVDSLESYAENKKAFAANLRAGRKCNIPISGWSCTRAAGHDGPCAAVEDASHE